MNSRNCALVAPRIEFFSRRSLAAANNAAWISSSAVVTAPTALWSGTGAFPPVQRASTTCPLATSRGPISSRTGTPSPSYAKYFEWEGLGVPVRLEIGPRDVASGQVVLARRTGGKAPVPLQSAVG